MSDQNICDTCKHWKRGGGDHGSGLCLRYPPKVVVVTWENDRKGYAETDHESVFPETDPDQTCGEWG